MRMLPEVEGLDNMADADTEPWKLAEHIINNALDDWWTGTTVTTTYNPCSARASLPRRIADALRDQGLLQEDE